MKPPWPEDWMIVEGVMTTIAKPQALAGAALENGVNIAPMGPIVDPAMTKFVFRPFKTSTTYQNLKATGQGVFHTTDDALLIARAAVGRVTPGKGLLIWPAEKIEGVVLAGACRYFELRVTELHDHEDRTTIHAEAVHAGHLRDFLGFNRAKHAVLEAAILATRIHLTGAAPVLEEFKRLATIVDKTGAIPEHQAMDLLRRHVEHLSLK